MTAEASAIRRRIAVVGDVGMMRDAVAAAVRQWGEFEVVAAGDGAERRSLPSDADRADVAVLLAQDPRGLRLPPPGERVPVVVVAPFERPEDVRALVDAGVEGCVSFEVGLPPLRTALERVAAGGRFLCDHVTELLCRPAAPAAPGGAVHALTAREREVLAMIAQGDRSSTVAQRLGLSVKTVQTHRRNLMMKLGVDSTAGLVRQALRLGLVSH
jgi:DNA-binding NarL/FixJ family response regulator